MIDRNISPQLRALAGHYPVVAVTGPRQSGKTTLCRAVFPDRPYVSLEALDLRAFAQEDPRGFLAEYQDGAVLDEIQRSGATVVADFFKHLPRFGERLASLTPKRSMRALVVYGGDASQRRSVAPRRRWCPGAICRAWRLVRIGQAMNRANCRNDQVSHVVLFSHVILSSVR